ncbi:MAG: ParB N-terminal domain-containing protein [Agriterribacter sp.]
MKIALASILKNPANPRIIKDHKFKQLVQSLKDFPQMMVMRPIIIDDLRVVLGGNMRLAALKELGYTEVPADWIKQIKGLSEDRKKEFIVKDNVSFGEWNWDDLANEWEEQKLTDWGVDIPDFNTDHNSNENDQINVPIPHYTLKVRFVRQNDCQRLFEELAAKGLDVKIIK